MASSGTDSLNDAGNQEPRLDMQFSDSDEEHEDSGFPLRGDYSSRMEEIMDDEEEEGGTSFKLDSDDEEEEGFVYTGVDSAPNAASNYRDRLREVLGQDELTDEDEGDGVPAGADVPKVAVEENHPSVSRFPSQEFILQLIERTARNFVEPDSFISFSPSYLAFT